MRCRIAWWKQDTIAVYVYNLGETYGAVKAGGRTVLLSDLKGTWEKAQMPSWEGKGLNGD